MAALTTLNITEKNANNSLSVTVKVNVTKEGVFTTTLSKEDVDKIHSYGIKLPTNRLGNEGYFNSIALSDLESQIREVLKRCLSYKIVEEVPVIKYQLETNCVFSYDKNGNIVPNPSKEWTGGDKNTDCKIYIPEKCKYCCKPSLKYYDAVRFRYGYTKRTMLFKLNGISIGKGHSEWGAPDNEVFILKLGNRIN